MTNPRTRNGRTVILTTQIDPDGLGFYWYCLDCKQVNEAETTPMNVECARCHRKYRLEVNTQERPPLRKLIAKQSEEIELELAELVRDLTDKLVTEAKLRKSLTEWLDNAVFWIDLSLSTEEEIIDRVRTVLRSKLGLPPVTEVESGQEEIITMVRDILESKLGHPVSVARVERKAECSCNPDQFLGEHAKYCPAYGPTDEV